MRRLILISLLSFVTNMLSASDSLSLSHFRHMAGVNIRPSLTIQSSDFFSGANSLSRKMPASASVHLQYAFAFPLESRLGRLYPTSYQGIGLASYTFMNHAEMGTPAAVYVFQGGRIAEVSPVLSLDYEWNFGASFGWHPFDELENPYNTVVGSRINAYINAGIMMSWQPSPDWKISAGVEYTHFSNGHTSLPNKGVNTVGLRAGASRSFGGVRYSRDPVQAMSDPFAGEKLSRRMSYELYLYGARKAYSLIYNDKHYYLDGRFGVAGLSFSPMYVVNRFFMTGLSLDIGYDESANLYNHVAGTSSEGEIRFYRQPFAETFSAGLSVRAEIVMPVFSINIGVGHNFLYKGSDLGGLYQIISLKTFVSGRTFIYVGYRFRNFEDPDNLMLGVGFRIGRNPRRP